MLTGKGNANVSPREQIATMTGAMGVKWMLLFWMTIMLIMTEKKTPVIVRGNGLMPMMTGAMGVKIMVYEGIFNC